MKPRRRRPPRCRHRRRDSRCGDRKPRCLAGHPDRAVRASRRADIAIPTALATPWPSGPVVTSTPLVCAYSGMTRGLRSPDSQRLDVVEFEPEAAEVELDVQRQAGVSTGQHESVPPRPVGVARVVSHHLLEQQVRDWGKAHRGARMAVADVLHGIGGQHTYGVDSLRVDLGPPLGENRAGDIGVGHAHVPEDPSETAQRAAGWGSPDNASLSGASRSGI